MLGHQQHKAAAQQTSEEAPVDEDKNKVEEMESEFHVQEIKSEETDISKRIQLVKDIRSQLDKSLSLASPSVMLQRATLGPIISSLGLVKPELDRQSADSLSNEYRNLVVEMLGRIPVSDIPKHCIPDLIRSCHCVLTEDNEENGAIAQKILADVHKSYKSGLEDVTNPYFEWLLKLFQNFPTQVQQQMKMASEGMQQGPIPAVHSMKIAQDIALTVFSLFQSYNRRLTQYGPDLVSVMAQAASIPGPALEDVKLEALPVYSDFRMAQIKALMFLIILSRSSTAQSMVVPYKDTICTALVHIMHVAPNSLPLRKELLNCLRTALSNDEFKSGLVKHLDDLLDLETLVGSDKAVSEGLRQVGFIHLTELVLMCKQELSTSQIRKVVDLAIQNLLDSTAALALHVTSVRVLYNIVVDILFPRRPEDPCFREILSEILECMASKLDGLNVQIPRIISISRYLEGVHKRREASKAATARYLTESGQASLKAQNEKIQSLLPESGNAGEKIVKDEQKAGDNTVEDANNMDVDTSQCHELKKEKEPEDKQEVQEENTNPPPPFKTVYQSASDISIKEKELLEFRNLAHGLLNATKTVAFVIIVFHTSKGLKSPITSHMKPWSTREADVRLLSRILESGLRYIAFFEHLVPPVPNFDPRDVLAEMFNVITDANEYADVFAPKLPFIYDTVLSNSWYLNFVRKLLEDDSSGRTFSNRYAVASLLDFLVCSKIEHLQDEKSAEGKLSLQLLQMCFEALPRIQTNDLQRGTQLAQHGVPSVERAVLPHILSFLKACAPHISSQGKKSIGYMKALRSLFFSLAATNKFLDIQSAIGASGLHIKVVDSTLSLLNGPASDIEEIREICSEICLLVPARLEHLIPLIPRMMQAAVIALNGSDRSIHVALRVLDVWVESFNPEFIERSMSAVMKPLMSSLWKHIKPSSQGSFGHKVAEMLGKMGGRGRRWIGEKVSVDYKEIPEYGLRVILAFPPHTSFLVPLDRCVQLAWDTVANELSEPYKRKNALNLLQICTEALARLHLPADLANGAQTPDQNTPTKDIVDGSEENGFLQMIDLLFSSKEPPQIPPDLTWPSELGVKTKKQHAAEKHMLETVLTALLASSYVEDEVSDCSSRHFAHATCRHFAILMAVGWATMARPPWAPPSSRMLKYEVLGGIPGYVATLKHLQPHIILDAIERGLGRSSKAERDAVVECMLVFLDTLIELGKYQKQATSEDGERKVPERASSDPNPISHGIPYINIQQDLITRARHCCYGDSWASRLGGVAALNALSKKMPQQLLSYAANYMIRALLAVLRSLPDSAVEEIQEITSTATDIVKRSLELPEDIDGKESESKDDLDNENPKTVTTRRGKRSKRTGTQGARKKQKSSPTAQASSKSADDMELQDKAKDPSVHEKDAARLQNDLLQAVMSSKNNTAVRLAAIKCLEIVANQLGTSIGQILNHILTRQSASKVLLERRILPLRSIPTQTNYAHSMAFLLRNCPGELELTPSLGAFIADSCTIMEIDETLVANNSNMRGQPPKPEAIHKLQVACAEVLVAALEWPAFREANEATIINHIWDSPGEINIPIQQLKERMMKVFVRSLGSSNRQLIDLCESGISVGSKYHMLEKQVLQDALRPILMDIAMYQKINIQLLDHLHRLLDLLSEQFNIALGQKILEHLQMWIDADKYLLGSPGGVAWETGTEWELAVRMLDVFYKLPDNAIEFLESQGNRPGLVVVTIGLELSLRSLPGPAFPSKCWSPYREPLVRFLSKYPKESINYFIKSISRLATPDYFLRLLDVIKHPSGTTLLEELKSSTDSLCETLDLPQQDPETNTARENCIRLISLISDLCPDWSNQKVYKSCLRIWETSRFEGEIYGKLTGVLLNYVRRHQDEEISILLKLPKALSRRSGHDLTPLKEYLMIDFPRESSSEVKEQLLLAWIEDFSIESISSEDTIVVRFLLKPMITWLVSRNQEDALSVDVIQPLVNKIFCQISAENSNCCENFQSEMVQICALLVEHVPHLLREYKKQIIQYVWWTLKRDNVAKSYAFLCVAHFFRAYQGGAQDDTKLVLKTFFNMIRMTAHDNASKETVKQAIDNIIPILNDQGDLVPENDKAGQSPKDQEGSNDSPSMKKKTPYPSVLKHLLKEEGLLSPVMTFVMHMVVRNRESFYSSRVAFIPVMLASLNRLGLPNSSSIDNRILSVDMAVTMYWWDEKAKSENLYEGQRATRLTKDMDTSILNFILRMTFVSCEVRDRDETGWRKLHGHCLSALRDAARYRDVSVLKLGFFDKLLQNSAQQQQQSVNQGRSIGTTPVLVTGLRILNSFMDFQPENLVEHCQSQILMMIEPSIYSKNSTTIDIFASVVRSFYSAFPSEIAKLGEKYASVVSIQNHLLKILAKFLSHIAEVEQFSLDVFWWACNCVRVMKAATEGCGSSMEKVLFPLLRAMNRIAKDHSKQPQVGLLSAKGLPQESLSNSEFGTGAWFMYHALAVAVPSSLVLSADHRKMFLSTVVELMAGNPVRQGQTHSGILFSVMHLLRGWLLSGDQNYLNPKESLVLLQRLAQVDRFHAIPSSLRKIWDKDFLDFLYTLITTRKENGFGDDVFIKVERPFCCGLQNPDPEVRNKFFKLYSERIPRDLYERLKYIIQTQEWDFLSNTFWLKHAVAFLFDCLHMKDPVTLAYNSAHVPQLFNYKESLAFPSQDDEKTPRDAENLAFIGRDERVMEGSKPDNGRVNLPEQLKALLSEHFTFLKGQSGLKSEALVSCLIEQVQTDPMVAHHLWVLLFPIVWTSLQKEQQTGLAKPIIQLLSKEHHVRQSLLRPTVGQTLLDGISMSQPQPKIPAEMIKYMGRHFHAWHTAISMLESHVGLFPQDMRCFDAVCDLYAMLGEEDMKCGLWQRRASAPETATAIALQLHGFVPQAQSLFLEMISRGVSGDVSGITKSEMVLWHNQYLACCMELNQWETVADYAKSVDNNSLRLEASSKLYDWSYLKTMIGPNVQIEDGADLTMIKAQMQMSDMTLLDVDKLCKTALSQCILKWWQMPESSPWSYGPVLHSFQRSVELMESWRVMMEFSMQGGQAGHYQDLKDIADTWKLRTPNEWESVRWWSDILTWRNHVYNTTIRQFSNLQSVNPNLHQLGYRDKAWSVNRLGHVARCHHLPEACINIINTLYGFNAMEVQEAFVKVQEQAKAYMQQPTEHVHGLNLINSTNLDYFQPAHHAEMICLKGQFLHLLGDESSANDTFSEALSLWPMCCDAWIGWGRFCDDQYTASRKQQNQDTKSHQERQPSMWLEYAATCYIQAIRSAGTEGRSMVPRLLHLLVLDVNGPESVGKHILQHAGDLPAWVWLPWISQLVIGLQRPENFAVKRLLATAAAYYPQYVYWHMRPAIVHLKEVAGKAVAESKEKAQEAQKADPEISGSKQKGKQDHVKKRKSGKEKSESDEEMPDAEVGSPEDGNMSAQQGTVRTPGGGTVLAGNAEKLVEIVAYESAKEVMEALRAKQIPPLQTLDLLITELGQRFAPRTDERLLAVVYTLQHRTYKVPLPSTAKIPDSLWKELTSVCRACSGASITPTNPSGKAGPGPWNDWNKYQIEFAKDLDINGDMAPKTLGELSERLKGWRTMMEAMIEDTTPSILRLEDLSPALIDMTLEEVEMPCQSPPSPDGPDPVFIERMGADVIVVRRACSSSRRLSIIGSDGQARTFLIAGQQSGGQGAAEERVGQLLRAANPLLLSHPESRRRGITFAAPRSQSLFQTGRIIEDDQSSCLYIDAYETYCSRYGRESDAPIQHFKEKVYSPSADNSSDEMRRQVYNEIVEKMVTENIFSQYMYKTMVENSKMMWTFKRQFALSTALSALACFVLRLAGRTPAKLIVSKATGELTHLELVTAYNDRLQLDINGETVPFRFTRNMAAFIGPHGLEGALVAAGVSAAQALQQEHANMSSLLALFLRDDVLAFIKKRLQVRSIGSIGTVSPSQVENAVMHNVGQCLSRLERMGPRNSVTAPTEGDLPKNPQKNMRDLLVMANSPQNLCKMDPLWQPWL